MTFEPTLESVRQHIVPAWYDEAKLGIFIHWGLYSAPAWAPHGGGHWRGLPKRGYERLVPQ